jgi:hypothetical protein
VDLAERGIGDKINFDHEMITPSTQTHQGSQQPHPTQGHLAAGQMRESAMTAGCHRGPRRQCEGSADGKVRGRRNAMLDDSDVSWHRQIEATVGGLTASVTGDPAVFVLVAAVHQGPSGGGPVAAIVKA